MTKVGRDVFPFPLPPEKDRRLPARGFGSCWRGIFLDLRAVPAYPIIFFAIIPVFLVMIAGVVFQRAGWLEGDLERGMMKLVLNLLTPCLIYTKIAGNPALEKASVAVWSISVGAAMILTGYAISWVAGRLSGLRRGEGLRTFTISTGTRTTGSWRFRW